MKTTINCQITKNAQRCAWLDFFAIPGDLTARFA